MKKYFMLMALAAGLLFMGACNEMSMQDESREGSLTVVLSNESIATKAATDPVSCETAIATLDYFLFEGGTTLYYHETVSSPTFDNNGNFAKTFNKLPASSYTVIIVANGQNNVAVKKTIAEIETTAISLAGYSASTGGFTMLAKKTGVSVVGGETTNISGNDKMQLERFASRVRLVSVTNTIPASANYSGSNQIQVNGVFLSNVNSAWTLGAASAATTATNVRGRKGDSKIVPTTSLEYPITAKFENADVAQSATPTPVALNWNCYALPTLAIPSGATSPKLVICATVNGTMYYYPVELLNAARTGIDRNKTYDVTVSISGTGSTDPDVLVVRGNINATVSVKPWVSGGDYNENI